MISYEEELYHHGIKGQKWGVRRYQNADGSLTAAGQERYNSLSDRQKRKYDRFSAKMDRAMAKSAKQDAKYEAIRQRRLEKKNAKIEKKIASKQWDIKAYDDVKDGLYDKKGREIFSKEDVKKSVDHLNNRIKELRAKQKTLNKNAASYNKYLERGEKQYNDVLAKYKNAKLSAMLDKGTKSDPAYKSAIANFVQQSMADANNYGSTAATKVQYSYYAEKNKRKNG